MWTKIRLYRCILVTTAGVCFALWVECVASANSEVKLCSKVCLKQL